MSKVIKVEALVSLFITVPDEATKLDIHSFLANNVDYSGGLVGISDEHQTIRVIEVTNPSEEIDMDWGDGNTVWQAYDGTCPDCGADIDTDVRAGEECSNCGHVFHEITEND
jgi:rubredoxin